MPDISFQDFAQAQEAERYFSKFVKALKNLESFRYYDQYVKVDQHIAMK